MRDFKHPVKILYVDLGSENYEKPFRKLLSADRAALERHTTVNKTTIKEGAFKQWHQIGSLESSHGSANDAILRYVLPTHANRDALMQIAVYVAHHSVFETKSGKFNLWRVVVDINIFYHPIIQRSMILKFQCAKRVAYML